VVIPQNLEAILKDFFFSTKNSSVLSFFCVEKASLTVPQDPSKIKINKPANKILKFFIFFNFLIITNKFE